MNKTDGRTKTCGLLGNPVEHTMSPAIHNRLAGLWGHNLVYVPFRVTDDLEQAVAGAYALGIHGLNVTIPYKSDVIPFLKETDRAALRIGAVNTLVREEGGYKGYNTDMPGLRRAMESDGVRLRDRQVIIIGAGGAARAAAFLAAGEGAREILILNRTAERAQRLADEVLKELPQAPVRGQGMEEAALTGQGWVAVQATNVGMYPHTGRAACEEEEFYSHIGIGYDLIFNPPKTRFMELVERAGGLAFNGLKMLVYQAAASYELWNQIAVPDEQARTVYEQIKEELYGRS